MKNTIINALAHYGFETRPTTCSQAVDLGWSAVRPSRSSPTARRSPSAMPNGPGTAMVTASTIAPRWSPATSPAFGRTSPSGCSSVEHPPEADNNGRLAPVFFC